MKYEVELKLRLEIDTFDRDAAEMLIHNIKQAAAFAEPSVKVIGDSVWWEEDDDGN